MFLKIHFKQALLKKANLLAGLFALGALAALTIFMSGGEVRGYDIWLHLKAGEIMVQSRSFLTHDIFSSTVYGAPWINHGWLFQVIAYLVFAIDGAVQSVLLLQIAIVTLTVLLLTLLGNIRRQQIETAVLLFLVVMIYLTRFNIRPDLLSLLFFTCYVTVLSFFLEKRWAPWVLCVFQVLWVNAHGFFIFGPLLLGVGIASEYCKRHIRLPWQWNESGRLDRIEFRNLKIAFALTLLSSFLNPQFLQGALYPITVIAQTFGESRIFFDHIIELRRPLSIQTLLTSANLHFKVLILVSGYSFILNRKKIDIGILFLWLGFLIFSFLAARNVVFFAFVAYIASLANLAQTPLENALPLHFKNKTFKEMTLVIIKIFLVFYFLQSGFGLSQQGYFDFDHYAFKSRFGGVSFERYPRKAADFILKNNITGHFLNDFNSGAYLIGRCFPQIRVFIDGRTELYGPAIFEKLRSLWKGTDEDLLQKTLAQYHITGAFLSSMTRKIPDQLLRYFYHHPDWHLVYLDYDGVIFLQDVPWHQDVIQVHRLDPSSVSFPAVDLMRLGPQRVVPNRQVQRAYILYALGFYEATRDQVEEALRLSPVNPDARYLLGKLSDQQGDYQEAFEHFRLAFAGDPGNLDFRYDFALASQKMGDLTGAIRYLTPLIKHSDPKDKVFFHLAKFFILDNQPNRAVDITKQRLNTNWAYAAEAMRIANVLIQQKDFQSAQEICAFILEKDPGCADAHYCMDRCFEGLKRLECAKEALDQEGESPLEFLPDEAS